jgi:dephospho-CoA kinase
MRSVALTGGIATGKSYVLDQFRRRGVPCLDADALTHGVLAAGTEATAAVAARFGADMLAPDGSVNRRALGPIVFADPAARLDLEAIVHPAVFRAIAVGLRAFARTDAGDMAVVDIPLLYESGHAGDFDRVVVTACTEPVQIARLRARGLDGDAARLRLAAQWPTSEKVARADFVIDTDGTMAETDRQVDEVLARLRGTV